MRDHGICFLSRSHIRGQELTLVKDPDLLTGFRKAQGMAISPKHKRQINTNFTGSEMHPHLENDFDPSLIEGPTK